jgi:hypothetical protein
MVQLASPIKLLSQTPAGKPAGVFSYLIFKPGYLLGYWVEYDKYFYYLSGRPVIASCITGISAIHGGHERHVTNSSGMNLDNRRLPTG